MILKRISLLAIYSFILIYSYNINSFKIVDFNVSMKNTIKYNERKISKGWGKLIFEHYQKFVNGFNLRSSVLIPKIIHHIWLGSKLPYNCEQFRQTWIKYHPHWIHVFWTDNIDNFNLGYLVKTSKELDNIINQKKFKQIVVNVNSFRLLTRDIFNQTINYGAKSDILRCEILYRWGGLYVDTDFECLKPFDNLHHCTEFYAGVNSHLSVVYNGLIGSKSKSFILKSCLNNLPKEYNPSKDLKLAPWIIKTFGPVFFTENIKNTIKRWPNTYAILPVTYFYPWPYFGEVNNRKELEAYFKPETLAVHHWHFSWNT